MARGIIGHLDPTRFYFPSSPWGYHDIGNDQSTGDTHCNSYQTAMKGEGLSFFRKHLSAFDAALASEIAVQGCSTLNSLKKYIPEDKLWPVNEVWDHHFTRNPYDGTDTTFIQQQMQAAEELFGSFDSVGNFVKKSMAVHAEFVKADVEYHRSRKGSCSGAMMWMYSDVWPCGTWALIDYYLEPKAAFYSAKRVFEPVRPIISQHKDGIHAFLVNDTLEPTECTIEVGQAAVDGNILRNDIIPKRIYSENSSVKILSFKDIDPDADYLYIHVNDGTRLLRNTFFHKLWKDIVWSDPELSVVFSDPEQMNVLELTIEAKKYARMVRIIVPDQEQVFFSDNYFDIEPGEVKEIRLESDKCLKPEQISIQTWTEDWNS
ncbi:hypothetical protein EOM86_08320 [Candidatus Nomurabacteria bacterium]|nr:hypothetical protein [Candidatus Nomurabacteria bacterium]